MKIYFASDHAGFELKNDLTSYVADKGFEVVDCGADMLDESDDYTDFIPLAAKLVSADPENTKAIVLGGSGQGEAIAANRFKHVRTTVYYGGNTDILKLGRQHNDANVLSLGARFLSLAEAQEAIDIWLDTEFSGEEKHVRRNNSLDSLI